MTDRVPLGEKEDLHREFKSRDALKKPEIIAREVVAMLNADGGTVSGRVRANTPTPFVFTAATRFQAWPLFFSITAVAGCPPGVRPHT